MARRSQPMSERASAVVTTAGRPKMPAVPLPSAVFVYDTRSPALPLAIPREPPPGPASGPPAGKGHGGRTTVDTRSQARTAGGPKIYKRAQPAGSKNPAPGAIKAGRAGAPYLLRQAPINHMAAPLPKGARSTNKKAQAMAQVGPVQKL